MSVALHGATTVAVFVHANGDGVGGGDDSDDDDGGWVSVLLHTHEFGGTYGSWMCTVTLCHPRPLSEPFPRCSSIFNRDNRKRNSLNMRVFSNTHTVDASHEYNRELYRLKFKWHMN